MSQVSYIVGKKARCVAYDYVIQTDLHRREQAMFQLRHVDGLVNKYNFCLACVRVVTRKCCRHLAKIIRHGAARVKSRDVNRSVVIMDW
jgi:hypothetical protein